ncbi:MAG: ABC-type dipeptide transport system, periplasmic component [Acidimicrobiales bacterium]|nr:ABC-type dipeptide transport system, periplasmic component [Acidimicrobiales bacterium]
MRGAATLAALALLAGACGGKKAGSGTSNGKGQLNAKNLNAAAGESGLKDAGKPVRGGTLVYGLEAESNGGFCLPEAQLAIAGMMVVRAFYDTLTVPNAKGEYVPYLAKSVTHNADYKQWDIKIRDGVKFSDGSPLTATVVKNNLDAYRGKYPGRSPLLFTFVFNNIDKVDVVNPTTVRVTTIKPWVAFPAFLYSSSRLGIVGQKQLDDSKTCDRKLIGTGPFKFVSWQQNQVMKGTANKDYWQKAPDGKPYPYVDAIEFRPMPEGSVRVNALQTGDVNVIHTSNAADIGKTLLNMRNAGNANMFVSEDFGEVAFTQLNTSRPPFNDIRMRKAFAMGADRAAINDISNDGLPTVANGPFAPGSVGYLPDPGFPKFNVAEAKKLVKSYLSEPGHSADVTLTTTTDASTVRLGELIQERAKNVGINMKINSEDQAKLINDAIGGSFQAMTFRNYPGGDPDTLYVWWYDAKKNPVNFSRFSDPVINKLLDDGRSNPDPAARKKIYEDLNREFAKQVWSVWAWFTPWAIVENKNVHGILGPPLPDGGGDPSTGLATGHSLIGMWITK